uniref:Reverse transcriptase domain-containing protein n=1 Tax=Tetradesmus obliquus TaxID=3088 RepID=A0A383WKW3_TETOB
MEHAEVAAGMMRPGDYMMVVDMKAGYHQMPVKPGFRKLLCFAWKGKVYQWQVMPFGLSSAPRAYSKLARCLLKRWRAMGIRCSNYIDDFIFFAASLEEAERIRAQVLRDLTALGWFISPGKCMLQPGTMVEYLGLVFCSLPEPHVRVPHKKLERAQALFQGVLRKEAAVGPAGVAAGQVRTQGHTLAVALGFLQSLKLAVAVVPLFTRELYACLNTLPRVGDGCFEYGSTVVLSVGALAECRFWQACTGRWIGYVVRPVAISRVVYTDGCGDGFGAMVHRVVNRRVEPAVEALAGSWEQEASEDSVYTELAGQ